MFTLLPGLYIFNKPFYINPFTADSRWDLPKYFLDLPNAAHSAVPTQTTTRCTLGYGHPASFFDSISSLWTHLFFFLMNPRTMMMPVAPDHAAHVFTVWRPAGNWGLLLGCGPGCAGDWRHPPELAVVTRCKLWSHRLHLSLTVWWLTDFIELWWCETLQGVLRTGLETSDLFMS